MLRGLSTVSYWADDLEAAKTWYSELLGTAPYYDSQEAGQGPGYYEFRIGDYQHELGLIDSRFAPGGAANGPTGVVVYWHVDDVAATYEKLLAMGAKEHEGIKERGSGTGFITASVVDPFGNILGIMENPHYLEVLHSTKAA
jgi:predicted enzyme related to lactoylglutathione lyase